MAPRQESFLATAHLLVKARLECDPALLGKAVSVPATNGTFTVTLNGTPTDPWTVLELAWEFTDWFNEDSGQTDPLTIWDLWEVSGLLFLQGEDGIAKFHQPIRVGESLLQAALPYLASLSLLGRSPSFWWAIKDADVHQLQGDIAVEVLGRRVKLQPYGWKLRPDVNAHSLNIGDAKRAASAAMPHFYSFFLTADKSFWELAHADAVVHLAQGLEVAAYAFVRPKIGSQTPKQFTPVKWFGPPGKRDVHIAKINAAPLSCYSSICELFGARHEWVHEGRAQVRPFDPATDSTSRDSTTYRPLSQEDYYRFRTAVSETLVWMGEPPIE